MRHCYCFEMHACYEMSLQAEKNKIKTLCTCCSSLLASSARSAAQLVLQGRFGHLQCWINHNWSRALTTATAELCAAKAWFCYVLQVRTTQSWQEEMLLMLTYRWMMSRGGLERDKLCWCVKPELLLLALQRRTESRC